MRERILSEIQRLAKENGGQPPGSRLFEQQTGIRQSSWRGVYWPRWGDAVTEAGLSPNVASVKYDEQFLLSTIADISRELGKIPTAMGLPNHKSIYRHFHSTPNMLRRLSEWTRANESYADIAAMLVDQIGEPEVESKSSVDGFVYLIQWGANYKIGRGDQLERRVKQVRTGLPDSGKLVHAIRTDDPPGIEAYWHRRFAEKRAENGEWFKLTKSDVAAFKRRKFQ
jgi:Meiotically Up-regulated Gene 113 (MUG113) protein